MEKVAGNFVTEQIRLKAAIDSGGPAWLIAEVNSTDE